MLSALRKLPPDKIIKEDGLKKGSHSYILFIQICLKLLQVCSVHLHISTLTDPQQSERKLTEELIDASAFAS
jgi:hypothetical protein